MYSFLLHTHYYLMIALLALLLFTAGRFFMNFKQGNPFGKFENTQSLLVVLLAHIQFIIGISLLFTSPLAENFSDMSNVMSNSVLRLKLIEHPTTMLIAIILVTVGRAIAKRKTESRQKFKFIAIFYAIALVLIAIRIPWQYISSHG